MIRQLIFWPIAILGLFAAAFLWSAFGAPLVSDPGIRLLMGLGLGALYSLVAMVVYFLVVDEG